MRLEGTLWKIKNIRTCSGAKHCLHVVEDKLYNNNPLPPLKQNKQSSPVFSTTNRINGEKNLDSWSLVLGTREFANDDPIGLHGKTMSYYKALQPPTPSIESKQIVINSITTATRGRHKGNNDAHGFDFIRQKIVPKLLVHGDMKQHCSELWPRFLAPETSVWRLIIYWVLI